MPLSISQSGDFNFDFDMFAAVSRLFGVAPTQRQVFEVQARFGEFGNFKIWICCISKIGPVAYSVHIKKKASTPQKSSFGWDWGALRVLFPGYPGDRFGEVASRGRREDRLHCSVCTTCNGHNTHNRQTPSINFGFTLIAAGLPNPLSILAPHVSNYISAVMLGRFVHPTICIDPNSTDGQVVCPIRHDATRSSPFVGTHGSVNMCIHFPH